MNKEDPRILENQLRYMIAKLLKISPLDADKMQSKDIEILLEMDSQVKKREEALMSLKK